MVDQDDRHPAGERPPVSAVRNQPEPVYGMLRNRCPDSPGITVRFRPDYTLQRTATAAVPGEGPVNERQAMWELIELARAEREGDYAWINAATVWALHSALDALVEQNSPAVISLVARIHAQELVSKTAAQQSELTAQLPEGALDSIVQAVAGVIVEDANIKIVRPRGNGAIRWERPLAAVGLGAADGHPIPPAMDRALAELCVLRDVLSHRGGRVDQKAANDWPSGALQVDGFVRISQSQVKRYSAAVGAYGAEISRRLLARFSVTVDLDLGHWELHGFFV